MALCAGTFRDTPQLPKTDLLAFGVSAISHVGDTFTQNLRELELYEASVRGGCVPVCRGYVKTEDDRIRGTVIESILCHGRVSKREIEKRFDIAFEEYFAPDLNRLREFESDKLIDGLRTDILRVTPLVLALAFERLPKASMRFSPPPSLPTL